MARDDDKKRRGVSAYSSYFKYVLLGLVVFYILLAGNVLPGGKSGALLPAGLGLRRAEEKQVPVPKTPRSVIRYYDGNTVVT